MKNGRLLYAAPSTLPRPQKVCHGERTDANKPTNIKGTSDDHWLRPGEHAGPEPRTPAACAPRGLLRAGHLNEHWFPNVLHARTVIETWRREYNEERPWSALVGLTPAAYAKRLAKIGYPDPGLLSVPLLKAGGASGKPSPAVSFSFVMTIRSNQGRRLQQFLFRLGPDRQLPATISSVRY